MTTKSNTLMAFTTVEDLTGTMELLIYEPVNEGMKVVRCGIVAGKMMRTEEDFRWCVENYKEN